MATKGKTEVKLNQRIRISFLDGSTLEGVVSAVSNPHFKLDGGSWIRRENIRSIEVLDQNTSA